MNKITKTQDKDQISYLAKSYSISFSGTSKDLSKGSKKLSLPKVGIYKSWRANMDEGWTRWVLEKYGFPLDTLHNQDIINGNLKETLQTPKHKNTLLSISHL